MHEYKNIFIFEYYRPFIVYTFEIISSSCVGYP